MKTFNADFLSRDELEALGLAALGVDIQIDRTVRIVGLENLRIADHVRIDGGVSIIASGPISIASYVHIAANSYLEGRAGIELKEFSNISSFASLHSVSDDFSGRSLTNPMIPDAYKHLESGQITVGRHVVVGTKSTVLPNVNLGDGAAIGAHSLVNQSVPEWTIWAGTPARMIKPRVRDIEKLEAAFFADKANR